MTDTICKFRQALSERILILDGAMGTMVQSYELTEDDYRGRRFADHPVELKGHHDLLSLTQPDTVRAIHDAYFAAGADIVETNTFSSTAIALADYRQEKLAYELNLQGASLAKEVAARYDGWVAGVLGPTNRTCSISPDVNDPSFRNITYVELVTAYTDAICGLVDGGADILLVETVFDTLNAKAALFAIDQYFERQRRVLPVMVSGTITDASGRTLSGQTTEAFWNSVRHINPLTIGLNCALGPADLRQYIEELSAIAQTYISAHPNAGLPNAFGEYDLTPSEMASHLGEWATSGFLNIVGGCCGTTPEHIATLADTMRG